MARGFEETPDSIVTESFGDTVLHIMDFGAVAVTGAGVGVLSKGPGAVYTSNIPSVVGYWFQATRDVTQTKEGVDVSLIAVSTGQFRFTAGETLQRGKLYVLSLT